MTVVLSPPGRSADVIISPLSEQSIGYEMAAKRISAASTATWPTNNLAVYVPLYLPEPFTVMKLWCVNGATASGNVDVGLYDEAGNRLISAGSTAQAGTNTIQEFDVADLVVPRGSYYMAISESTTVATIFQATAAAPIPASLGILSEATALPLPATATFALPTIGVIPILGIAGRTLVN